MGQAMVKARHQRPVNPTPKPVLTQVMTRVINETIYSDISSEKSSGAKRGEKSMEPPIAQKMHLAQSNIPCLNITAAWILHLLRRYSPAHAATTARSRGKSPPAPAHRTSPPQIATPSPPCAQDESWLSRW